MSDESAEPPRLGTSDQLSVGFALLNFNQGLIQFADSKANGLVLVNSIFLASALPFLDALKDPATAAWWRLLLEGFLGASVLSLVASLAVIVSRGGKPASRARGLLYFAHIVEHKTADDYVHAFRASAPSDVVGSIVATNHELAAIVAAKFRAYAIAQALTLATAALWIAGILAHVLGR